MQNQRNFLSDEWVKTVVVVSAGQAQATLWDILCKSIVNIGMLLTYPRIHKKKHHSDCFIGSWEGILTSSKTVRHLHKQGNYSVLIVNFMQQYRGVPVPISPSKSARFKSLQRSFVNVWKYPTIGRKKQYLNICVLQSMHVARMLPFKYEWRVCLAVYY